MTFTELGLSESVLKAVSEAGYETPTPIQKQAIPQVLMGRDVLGCAQTGTGKTASFTLPMIDILGQGRAKARMPRSLILEPTRELAAQVEQNFETYGKYTKLTTALLIGGVSFAEQDKKLDRGVDVLIATPGRLLDHVERGKVLMNDVSFLVIDEADRMLDMGFIPDVERIVSYITKKHQTLLFSATMPKEIRRLADRFLKEPKEITVAAPSSVAETVEQALLIVQHRDKRAALRALLRSQDVQNGLIFCNRKRDVGVVHRSLVRHGFDAGALHGDMDQFQRTDTLEKFKANEIQLLVCSDVAARGLDIAAVSHVFNFDVPTHAEDYVHRIGRTGRAGRSGKAYTLAAPEDSKYIAGIEKLTGKEIPRIEIEEFAGAALKEETAKSRRGKKSEKATDEKTGKKARKQDEKSARKDKQGKRGDRRNRDGIGDVPDYGDVPFGETDLVPAFLKRSATL
jgi:superfamily II DNA/RNA helicase